MHLKELRAQYKNGQLPKQDYINQMHEIHKSLFEYAHFLKETDIGSIEMTDDTVIMTTRTDGIKLLCDKDDRRIIPIEILNFGSYENDVFEMMKVLIEDNFKIFDIGGNIGWYAINIAKAKRNISVFTFEPIPKTYDYLRKNLALNGVDNVSPYNFGFSKEEQELTFYYYPEVSGNASLANLSGKENVQQITSRVKRLDDFIMERNLSVDFIKCDVEGAELFVFQGGIEAIKKHKPVIFVELLRKWAGSFNYHPNEVIELLCNCGYQCFTASGEKLVPFGKMDEDTQETNFFFLHGEKHSGKIKLLVA